MEKALNRTQLKAKMYEVLMTLHTNHPNLTFHVIDERDEHPKSNRILVRGSFIKPIEGKEFGEEFAAIEYLDANSDILSDLAYDLGDGFEASYRKTMAGETSWKKH